MALCIERSTRPIHFVGVGSVLRHDDAAGLKVVASIGRRLGATLPDWVKVHQKEPPERTLSRIPAKEGVVVFDAVEANMEAGGIVCTTLADTKYGFFGTHNIPLKVIPGLAERPDTVYVIGIQPQSLEVGEGLSPVVRRSVKALVEEVVERVKASS